MVKLLIIDDDCQACDFLKDFFTLRKCTVFTAMSGEAGITAVKEHCPDIVLLDVKMPDMSGLDVLKEIKALNKNIKVIIITVDSDEITRIQAKESGADDFIRKPVNIKYLEGVVSLKVFNPDEKTTEETR